MFGQLLPDSLVELTGRGFYSHPLGATPATVPLRASAVSARKLTTMRRLVR